MGRSLIALVLAACSFPHHELASSQAQDGPPDSISKTCGNGTLEPGEECEVGMTTACSTACGMGTTTCRADCTKGTCDVDVAPTTAWQISSTAQSWSQASLPNVDWGCTNCTRYFRTTVCGKPSSVDFRWSSDNGARMTVNDKVAFDAFWFLNYCSDEPCCTKCCDTNSNCLANVSAPETLDAAALALFTTGSNVLRWEVYQEYGGSGFYTTMTVHYGQ